MTDPTLSVHAPVRAGLAALLALVAGFGLWATQTTLAGAVLARGEVAVDGNHQPVQHPDGGVVTELLVEEGDAVAAGDVLLRLDGSALRSKLRIVEDQLTELAARAARLEAERDGTPAPVFPPDLLDAAALRPDIAAQLDGQRRLFAARFASLVEGEAQLARRIAQTRSQARGLTAQRSALDRLMVLAAKDRAAQDSLYAKGLVRQAALLALDREAARLAGEAGELDAALAQTADRVTEIEIQISALKTRRREDASVELRDIGPIALELAETRRALSDTIARLDVRAPVAGTVVGLQVTAPQTVLRAADTVLTLVPKDRGLYVTARISPLQVEAVRAGQAAELVILPLAGVDAPRLSGRVTLVSADALTDPNGTAFYLVRVEIDPGEALRLDDKVLLPGMPVEVYLQTARRTPLTYLLEPFTAYFARAMREG